MFTRNNDDNMTKVYPFDMHREELLTLMKAEKDKLLKEACSEFNQSKRELNHIIAEFLSNKIYFMEREITELANENYESHKKELAKINNSQGRY